MKHTLLLLLKFVPAVGALCCALNSILSYFEIDAVWLGYIQHAVFLIAWILLAIYFKFCIFYMILVLYILVCQILNTIDYIWGLPVSDRGLYIINIGLIGITAISATIAHVKHTKRNKKYIG